MKLIDQEIKDFCSRATQRVRDTYGKYLDDLLEYRSVDANLIDLNVTLCHAMRILKSEHSGLSSNSKRLLMGALSKRASLQQYVFMPMAPIILFDRGNQDYLSGSSSGTVVMDSRTMTVQDAVTILWEKSEEGSAPYAIYGGTADPNSFHISVRNID